MKQVFGSGCVYLLYSTFSSAKMFKAQRGTGLSTPLTPSSMSQFKSAEKLANYLRYFRADNIVNDAEFIRRRLVPEARPWTVLGQVINYFFTLNLSCVIIYIYANMQLLFGM